MRDLTVCGKLVIYVEVEAGVDAFEVYIYPFVLEESGGDGEVARIESAGIVCRHVRRVDRVRIFDIGVVRRIITASERVLPVHRDGELVGSD